jgi:putative SOS response-associated peptidase YedK
VTHVCDQLPSTWIGAGLAWQALGMCGRYSQTRDMDKLRSLFGVRGPMPEFAPRWNIAPSMAAPVIRRHPETGERHADLLSWGLVPGWTKSLAEARKPINARAETVGSSGMFKAAYARRRALVPADAFYEWRRSARGKQPYAIARVDGAATAFAGLWEGWRAPNDDVLRSFAVITTEANALMAPIHDRMPVILEPGDWPFWLGEVEGDPAPLMRPAADRILTAWPVSPKVNSVRNDGPELVKPVGEARPTSNG